MLHLTYNFSIHVYSIIIRILSPFHPKAKYWIEGRKYIFERLQSAITKPHTSQKIAWFHCASLGEFEQGRPLIEAFRTAYPAYKILLTFFSPSGYEIRKNYIGADFIFYLPADTPANAQKFIAIVRPSIALFVKYEFWVNYINELKKCHIPLVSFSAIFRPNQIFFKPYGDFYKQVLIKFDQFLVQNQSSFDLLKNAGIPQVMLGGDTRFDRVKQIADTKKEIIIAKEFKANRELFMIGSAWQTDLLVLIPFINSLKNVTDLAFVIAPHEIYKEEIRAWQKQINSTNICFSEVNPETKLDTYQVLIVDNIGMLSSLYQYADFAFIGGSFGKGLHNILEAATFGMPIFFGNKAYRQFQEAVDLISLGGAFAVASSDNLAEILEKIRSQKGKKKEIGRISEKYILQNIGATEKVLSVVRAILGDK